MSDTFIIVGAGQAGAWVARTLRAEGFAGEVLLIGAERYLPYERPPLSKGILAGSSSFAEASLLTDEQLAEHRISHRPGETVIAIDRATSSIRCAGGAVIGYDRLFLTTGASPRRLAGHNPAHPRVHYLRDLDDAERLTKAITASRSIAVLGGGWIGLEVAATIRSRGLDVTVVEAADRLCARSAPSVLSAYLAKLHRDRGVDLRLGCQVSRIDAGDARITLQCEATPDIIADHLVVGIGVIPETALAAACGLDVSDGIVVDAAGRTSDPAIFAAGDVTSQPCRFAGRHVRRESWANAQNQAIVAARAALGHDVAHPDVPWMWSDQFGVNMQIVGMPERGLGDVARGDPMGGQGSWLMTDAAGMPVGAIAINSAQDLRPVRRALETGRRIDPAQWADIRIPAKQIGAARS